MLCPRCGGKLQGDVCPRHGSRHKPPPSFSLSQPVSQPVAQPTRDPFSPETDRRVFAMVGTVCKGCQVSCGDLGRCPVNRARWFGDWNEEAVERRHEQPENVQVLPLPLPAQKSGFQMSFF